MCDCVCVRDGERAGERARDGGCVERQVKMLRQRELKVWGETGGNVCAD